LNRVCTDLPGEGVKSRKRFDKGGRGGNRKIGRQADEYFDGKRTRTRIRREYGVHGTSMREVMARPRRPRWFGGIISTM
jgi:hypothetical protein